MAVALPLARAAQTPPVIPVPQHFQWTAEKYKIDGQTKITATAASRDTAEFLAERLRRATGFALVVDVTSALSSQGKNSIRFEPAEPGAAVGDEGYQLRVSADGIAIGALTDKGWFYGVQTLLQLLPPQVLADKPTEKISCELPGIEVTDWPRYRWRGVLIDAGRHFVASADIKRMLDGMALHKLNVLHWHLTEDQGWRIEIKKYPRLTEVGAWRDSSPPYGDRKGSDGQRYGGFYTQAEVKDVVSYATARHITVMPEIEMPGHSAAAIAAYPQFGNDDIADFHPKVATQWGVHPFTYAPKEETFRFLEDVLTEVCALFPSPYLHIGGDEAPKTQWKESKFAQAVMKREGLANEEALQSWFVRRIEKFLTTKNRRLVGWDEINEGGLSPSATMMIWRDPEWAKFALERGNDIVMSPKLDTYLNFYQAPVARELAKGAKYEQHGGMLTLEKAYAFDPSSVTENPEQAAHILGTEASLWGEYLKDFWKLQYMAFPRTLALAEVAWSLPAAKNLADFKRRLESDYPRLDAMGIVYFR